MSESDRTKPPAEWLQQLSEAGHWDRLIQLARDSLAIDPNDPETHRRIAWAYAKTERLPELARHVEFLLSADPDDVRHHHLAAVYYLEAKKPKQAEPHIATILRLEPHSATYHYVAGIHALRTNQVPKAREHLRKARELLPGWAAAAHLEIQIDGIHQKTARDAWDRIRRLEEALVLDPVNAAMMTSIGEIYLAELERPRDAEKFFRQALFLDPSDRDRQALLLKSIRSRSLLYRTLSLPTTAGTHILQRVRSGSFGGIFIVFAIKALALFVAWLIVVGALFTPAAKVYEWMVMAGIPRTRQMPRILAPLAVVLGWPLWLRMLICGTLIVSGWTWILWAVCHVRWLEALQIMGCIFGAHFAFLALLVGVRQVRARFGRWQHQRRHRRSQARASTSHSERGEEFEVR